MENQTKVREQQVVHTPCPSMEAVFGQEYMKGEISGIFNFAKMPMTKIESLTEDIKIREAMLPLEDGENE